MPGPKDQHTAKVAPPKNTGGGGFSFEDKVVAYLFLYMLNGEAPFRAEDGIITKMRFQSRMDGWLLDDVLLTLSSNDTSKTCACSIKSLAISPVKDFARIAWQQYLHDATTVFNRKTDLQILLAGVFDDYQYLHQLLQIAQTQSSADLPNRLSQSGIDVKVKPFFVLTHCPEGLAKKHKISEVETGNLLKTIRFRDFDFEQANSKTGEALTRCRQLLSAPDEAQQLWDALLAISQEFRPLAGEITHQELVNKLRARFQLRSCPYHEADWAKLNDFTQKAIAIIPDTIAGEVPIPRTTEVAAIQVKLNSSNCILINGDSGCGKTVLLKKIIEGNKSSAIFFDANTFNTTGYAAFESDLGLANPLSDIIKLSTANMAILAIDGLDRIFTEQTFKNIATLINSLNLTNPGTHWRIVITTQTQEEGRIKGIFSRLNIHLPWVSLPVSNLTSDDLSSVWKRFPALQPLTTHPHLKGVILKPKVLDLLARHIQGIDFSKLKRWATETDLIQWFWETEVLKNSSLFEREVVLFKLAELQATNSSPFIASSAFTPDECRILGTLCADKLCRADSTGKLTFFHELYADWARFRFLLGKQSDKNLLNGKSLQPLWNGAIRLFSQHLLSQPSTAYWDSIAVEILNSSSEQPVADIFLEAVFFSDNCQNLLEKQWPQLEANKGHLLRRVLNRFLYTATFPDPIALAQIKEKDPSLVLYIEAQNRLPLQRLWPPVIKFLHAHIHEVTSIAPLEVSKIADQWLRLPYIFERYSGRPISLDALKEAAGLAILNAEKVAALNSYKAEELKKSAYRAALAAIEHEPKRVQDFALTLCARTDQKKLPSKITQKHFWGETEEELTAPWPDGPYSRVDSVFQDICLNSDALSAVIKHSPQLAREVILALLIEEPSPVDSYADYHPFKDMQLGLNDIREWIAVLYFRGPFLAFLKTHPEEGVETILRLINFATDRWRTINAAQDASITITIDSVLRTWTGDFQVYHWYTANTVGPHETTAALMALEKYLYDEIDAKRPIEWAIKTILAKSSSVAFGGLLGAIGRKQPELLEGPLKPLLTVSEFNYWELAYTSQSPQVWRIPWSHGLFGTRYFIDSAESWHGMPHRKNGLNQHALTLFLKKPEMRPFFAEIKKRWEAEFASGDDSRYKTFLENLIPQYALENWKQTENGLEYTKPKELQEKYAEEQKGNDWQLAMMTLPLQCRQVLDGEKTFAPELCPEFWEHLTAISKMPSAIKQGLKEGAICAGFAVLVLKHMDWLNANPEKKEWLKQKSLEIINNPPQTDIGDSEFSKFDHNWNTFCSEYIPTLWAETPGDTNIKRAIAILAAHHQYLSIAKLFSSSAKLRTILGLEFHRLQNIECRIAVARVQAKISGPEKASVYHKWITAEIESFATLSDGPGRPDFSQLIPTIISEFTALDPSIQTLPHFDVALAVYANYWQVDLGDPQDSQGRKEKIDWWIALLTIALKQRLTGKGKSNRQGNYAIYDSDRLLLKCIASICATNPAQETQRLYQVLFRLGRYGEDWIEAFLLEWLKQSISTNDIHPGFISYWQHMIDFAESEGMLSCGRDGGLLVGISAFIYWPPQHTDVVIKMRSYVEKWLARNFKDKYAIRSFLEFALKTPGNVLLIDAINWLPQYCNLPSDKLDKDLEQSIIEVLALSWETEKERIKANALALSNFNALLGMLVAKQNVTALALHSKVACE